MHAIMNVFTGEYDYYLNLNNINFAYDFWVCGVYCVLAILCEIWH